jgi:hypothetical protein
MHAHRRTRRFGITTLDRIVNIFVLAIHAIEIPGGIVVRERRRIDARARDDGIAKLAQDAVEVAVARGLRPLR